jgi:hypothetical protein
VGRARNELPRPQMPPETSGLVGGSFVTVRSGPSFPVESGSPTMVSTTNGSGHHEAREP